jgi:hypothetical protein
MRLSARDDAHLDSGENVGYAAGVNAPTHDLAAGVAQRR